ncbi:MAG: hypothetical protein OXG55_13260 [bacterium]|nr:hypothetical protein [bacterium]
MSLPPVVVCPHRLRALDAHRYDWPQAEPALGTMLGDYSPICCSYPLDDYLADARSRRREGRPR